MPQIYENAFEVTVPAGSATCLTDPQVKGNSAGAPSPPRGVLRKITIKQINGTTDGYTLELFNRRDACADVAEISSTFDEQKLVDPDLHRICPPVVAASGVGNVLQEQFNLQHAYQNLDEQDVRRTPQSRIYFELNPTGAGNKTFQIAYAIEPVALV